MPLVDWQIKDLSDQYELITPFNIKRLSSMGYDLTLDIMFKIPVLDTEEQVIDPFNPPQFQIRKHLDYIIVPPHSFVLGCSRERLSIPKNIIGVCLGRSTYARAGVITHVTPLEPGWKGTVTLELSNTNPLPVKVWVDEGITQVVFFESKEFPLRDYEAKGGRYQNQEYFPVQGRPNPTTSNERLHEKYSDLELGDQI